MNGNRIPINYYDLPGIVEKFKTQKGAPTKFVLELPALRENLPKSLTGLRVLELGCGLGTFLKELLDMGAESVIGVDLSSMMIQECKTTLNNDVRATLINCRMEEVGQYVPDNSIDLVVSCNAMMYIRDFQEFSGIIHRLLKPGTGKFTFVTLHPVRTAGGQYKFIKDENNGEIKYWGISNYLLDNRLICDDWLDNHQKDEFYHKTLESYLTGLLNAGFRLDTLKEPTPIPSEIEKFKFELHRPKSLLLSATKTDK
eukprot:gene4345-5437_t